MFNAIIRLSIRHRVGVVFLSLLLLLVGAVSYQHLVIDAVPDITNVQVQINSEAEGYSPFEVEQRITIPLEVMMSGLPNLQYTRSLSRYGLSQITVVFQDGTDIYFARQLITQRLVEAKDRLPDGIVPTLGPIATGLGEIFMYTVENDPNATPPHSLQTLREVQDWVVKPQLRDIPGVVEVNSVGGAAKQIIVTPNLDRLRAYHLSIEQLASAIRSSNANIGAGFLEERGEQFLIRVPSQLKHYSELEDVIVGTHRGSEILVRDVAEVQIGSELRTGAATENGREVVLGTVFMLIGENGRAVSERVKERIEFIQPSLPPGVVLTPMYDRSVLVNSTIQTVQKNLFEGALLVVAVLFLALGNLRAAIITAFIIPLSMCLAVFGMVQSRISANLMSLGALDFGLLVDGAVILVENCTKRLGEERRAHGRDLSLEERLEVIYQSSVEVRQATVFGELTIMSVYVPILALGGIEGKMYTPMALTVLLALGAAFLLSLTFVPAAVALFVTKGEERHGRAFSALKRSYKALLHLLLQHPRKVLSFALIPLIFSGVVFSKMGSEFIPSLDEGDVALHALRIPGTSLSQSIQMQHQVEKAILPIPEVSHVFAKIGTAEIATDPMPPNVADGYVVMKPRHLWPDPEKPKAAIVSELEERLSRVPGNNYEFTQPIQMRFNELIAGVRSDVAVKIFGDDSEVLKAQGELIQEVLEKIPGAADVKLEQVTGLPMIVIQPDRSKLARVGISPHELQNVIRTAYAGEEVTQFYEGDRSFPVVVRLSEETRNRRSEIGELPIALPDRPESRKEQCRAGLDALSPRCLQQPDGEYRGDFGRGYIALKELATVQEIEGPNQISRENGKRRVVVTLNVRGRDLGSFVKEAQEEIRSKGKLPPNYWLGWGGQYENLLSAQRRLMIVVPLVLLGVFGLVYLSVHSLRYAVVIFSGVPFALTGGVLALWIRDIPFSISAAVGFIALTGVSVLNGLVLVSFTVRLLSEGGGVLSGVIEGATSRIRPVLMTALVASLGFVPMALSHGIGSEVQRPLATVVIGGIISSTVLTLLVLPALLSLTYRRVKPEFAVVREGV